MTWFIHFSVRNQCGGNQQHPVYADNAATRVPYQHLGQGARYLSVNTADTFIIGIVLLTWSIISYYLKQNSSSNICQSNCYALLFFQILICPSMQIFLHRIMQTSYWPFMCFFLPPFLSLSPVSYTHLDVYKRQPVDWSLVRDILPSLFSGTL